MPGRLPNKPIDVPPAAVGACLYRHQGEDLIGCEHVMFEQGSAAVSTVLRRAAISGRVELGGKIEDHFIDLLDANQDIIATVALDGRSYNALKNRWMRCKVVKGE